MYYLQKTGSEERQQRFSRYQGHPSGHAIHRKWNNEID